jgi:hypothetical protein
MPGRYGQRQCHIPYLLQTVRQLEDVVEVILGEFRDTFTEIAVLKVVRKFLRMIQSAILLW